MLVYGLFVWFTINSCFFKEIWVYYIQGKATVGC